MASKKTLAQRIYNICRISPTRNRNLPQIKNRASLAHDPGDNAAFSRFLHKKAASPAAGFPGLRSFPTDRGNLMERIKEIGIVGDRIRFDLPAPATVEGEDLKKLLRVSKLDAVRARLREIQRSSIPYSDFVKICEEGCSSPEEGRRFAKTLDDSGNVVVFGDVVILKPEKVAKAILDLVQVPQANPRDLKELEEMEKHKWMIDQRAEALVRRELWLGLAYLVVQTAGFMRLTFWELTWDVMEPICFYVTSMYFMAGYTFFLKTSKEPSFEGFYDSRFSAKQTKLMKLENFDLQRYRELRKACHQPDMTTLSSHILPPRSYSFDKSDDVRLNVVHDN